MNILLYCIIDIYVRHVIYTDTKLWVMQRLLVMYVEFMRTN